MSTHRVTLDLSPASYRNLRKMVDSGEYDSESDAISGVLIDIGLGPAPQPGEPAFERWMLEDVYPADDELEADPDSGLTPEELDAHLAQARLTRTMAR